ncbi:MAG: hypothetical protein ACR2IF_03895 [Terriglobales bacterium]
MRRVALLVGLSAILTVGLIGCGHGSSSSSTSNVASSIVLSATAFSLNTGDVGAISAAVVDANGVALTSQPKITFSSSNPVIASVSSGGLICAGTWDASFVVCHPAQVLSGTANIIATSGAITATATVTVHPHIDRVEIAPTSVNCLSQGNAAQFTAKAFSNGTDVTSLAGPVTWISTTTTAVAIDTTGLAGAIAPGQGTIFAKIGSVNSTGATFVTCPVQRVSLHVANSAATSVTLAPAGTAQLQADAFDSMGKQVNVNITFSSSLPPAATVAPGGLVTANGPGTAVITAACSTGCNINMGPVYGNAVVVPVTGSSGATTVYATGTASTSLVPIDTGTNAAGTAFTLPSMPNSFLFNRLGTKAYLGSSAGLITFDPTLPSSNVTQNTNFPGKVLAVSPDSNRVIVAGTSSLFIIGVGGSAANETYGVGGATAADFSPDSTLAFIVAGNLLEVWTPGSLRAVQLSGSASDVSVLRNGVFAYLAGGAASPAVTAQDTCTAALADTVSTTNTPALIRSLPDASALLAVESPGVDVITPSSTLTGCPPPLTDSLASLSFARGSFTARQLVVTPNSVRALITSDLPGVEMLTVPTSTLTVIPLANNASTFAGASTQDSGYVYLGGSDNQVHRVNVNTAAEDVVIPVSFTPDLVAIRLK